MSCRENAAKTETVIKALPGVGEMTFVTGSNFHAMNLKQSG